MPSADIELGQGRVIPGVELTEQVSTSGGPGGQHANKTSSRVSLRWNIGASTKLTDATRVRLLEKLGPRLTKDGELIVHVDSHRSQHMNRAAARTRMGELVAEALVVPKRRKKTKPTRASQRRRIEGKKRRGEVKRGRGKVQGE